MAALLLAVVAIFFFSPDAVEGRVLQQHDMQQGMANGHETQIYTEETGHIPRWTDALFGGMPTYQISPHYPVNDMLGWIARVYTLWLPTPADLLFGMMLGFFIMCLCMKGKWHEALFGAIAWGLSSYFIIIIGAGHIMKFLALMYIPPTIGGIVLCYRGKYLGGTALAALFGAMQLMSNHIQMSYYFLFVIIALIIAWLIVAIRKKKTGQWGLATACVVAAGIIAVAANSSNLYNTYAYAKETIRGKATEIPAPGQTSPKEGVDLEYMTQWSYGKGETFSLLIPNIKGGATIKPEAGENHIKSLAETSQANEMYERGTIGPQEMQVLQQLPQYFGDQPMTNGPVYVGAFVLVLAILALFVVKGPIKWALFIVSILALMLSWGNNLMWLTEFFANNIPAYSRFRTVASILVILEFTIPVLAVLFLRYISKHRDNFAKTPWLYYSIMGGAMLICLIAWMAPGMFGDAFSSTEKEMFAQQGLLTNPQFASAIRAIKEVRMGMVQADALRSFLYIAAGSVILVLYLRGTIKSPRIMACFLATLTLCDLFSVNKRYIDSDSFTEDLTPTDVLKETPADREINRDKGHYRVMDVAGFNDSRSSYFHNTIGGYHAAKLTRYNDLITHQIAREGGPNIAVLNMLNAKYFLNGDSYQQNPDALGNGWFVSDIDYVQGAAAEMKGLDSLDTRHRAVADASFRNILGKAGSIQPGDTVRLTEYNPDKLTYNVRSGNGGVAVFSEVYFPWGWEATIDGKPAQIGRVNYVLRALRVPAGEHTVVFTFYPQSDKVTNALSICGIVVIYLCCASTIAMFIFYALRHKRRKEEKQKPEQ